HDRQPPATSGDPALSKVSDPTRPQLPRVALLVETHVGPGRDMLRGIARYVRESGPWSLHLEAREQQFIEGWEPKWLNDWKGHGIIARCDTRAMVKAISRTKVPVVDVLGDARDCLFPLVHVDDAAVAQLAAQHLLDRGFRRFGFVTRADELWSQKRFEAFSAAVGRYNCTCEVLQAPDFETMPEAWDDLIE